MIVCGLWDNGEWDLFAWMYVYVMYVSMHGVARI